MGTISDKLMRIINTKEDIRQALISKGYDVPTSIPFKEYAKMISDLPCRVDSFPDIEGIVARYSALGLTNEQMAANPVWVDKTGNGHDIQLKNFSWKGMSGVGGYVQDFNDFRNNATVDKIRIDEQGSNSIKVTILTTGIGNAIYIPKNIYQFNKSYFIKISSEGYNEGDLSLSFHVPSTSTATTVKVPLNPNGITEIPAIKEDDFLGVYISVGGKVGSITIEQLPLYPGALVFDGVDDYGTCNNFPILTKEKGYTVVALRQWLSRPTDSIYGLISNTKNWFTDGAFIFEYQNNSKRGTTALISFGQTSVQVLQSGVLSYQTSLKYNEFSIVPGNFEASERLIVGSAQSARYFANAAIWEICILDHDATEEELQKIQDYYKKEYPWLFPDQAWTVTGKTNEDADRATIANITGNGNNLVLSNFGFAENSGYGLYPYNYANWNYNPDRVTVERTPFKITIKANADTKSSGFWKHLDVLKQKIKVTGLPEGVKLKIGRTNDWRKEIAVDGVYDVNVEGSSSGSGDLIVGYLIDTVLESCDITIEQIPEYEGYLVTDGVDDSGRAVGLTIPKDFTLVGEWILFSKTSVNAGLSVHPQIHIFNRPEAIQIVFRTAGKTLPVKSLKAICSDGRCYDENWSELKINVGEFTDNKGTLFVASNGTNYAQIAFKNLGIYDNQILSKNDCIKAYNYLQTLKS